MAINRWRNVEYTDDGCYLYQCLSCYGTWEGRSRPNYSGWSFCPMCGVKWEGEHECRASDEPRHYRLGSFEEGQDRYRNEKLWVIERREIVEHDIDNSREERRWKVLDSYSLSRATAVTVHAWLSKYKTDYQAEIALQALEEEEERRECEEEGEKYYESGCRIVREHRARIVRRSDLNR